MEIKQRTSVGKTSIAGIYVHALHIATLSLRSSTYRRGGGGAFSMSCSTLSPTNQAPCFHNPNQHHHLLLQCAHHFALSVPPFHLINDPYLRT